MGIGSCINSLKCKGIYIYIYIYININLRVVQMYMFLVSKIRGIQKSYYSGDFIVNNSDVDDHLEALGYFSGVVSIYCLLR